MRAPQIIQMGVLDAYRSAIATAAVVLPVLELPPIRTMSVNISSIASYFHYLTKGE